MNLKIFVILAMLTNVTLTGFSKPVKVTFSYNLDNVSLIYNDVVFKDCPKKLSIDFDLGGQLIAFRPGYESQLIKISSDNSFTSYNIMLTPLGNKFSSNLQVELKKASFINYVTNFTQEEVTEIINSKMSQCNITASTQNTVFKNANGNTKRFSIGAEVLKSISKNGSYSSPYYLLSHQRIKWYVMDNDNQNLILEFVTDGLYMAYFKSSKGILASDRLKEITALSLEEATQKFINSDEFSKVISSR